MIELNGFINVYKPCGMTSNNAVVKVRGLLKAYTGNKKITVGHVGTLDPGVDGVLLIAVGKAARLFQILDKKKKVYIAQFTFGETTETLDTEGEVISKGNKIPTEDEIISVLDKFKGYIEQVPPPLSAININGVKAYKLVRHGIIPEMKSRQVYIEYIKLLSKNDDGKSFTFEIKCGGGTYIRSLSRDIAKELGTVGYMSSLRRTKVGEFSIEDSATFDELNANPSKYIVSVDEAVTKFDIPIVDMPEEISIHCMNGIPEKCDDLPDGMFLVRYQGNILSLGYRSEDGKLVLKERLR